MGGRPRGPRGRHRAVAVTSARAGDPAWVSRRVAMALFGGGLTGAVLELATDATPAAVPAAAAGPATSPSTRATSTASAKATAAPTSAAPGPSAVPSPTQTAPAPAVPAGAFAGQPALEAALAAVPRGKAVAFGVAVVDGRTGRRYVSEVGAPYETASTVKVDILAATYVRARAAGRGLTATERSLATRMIRNSDNDAAQRLFVAAGDRSGLQAFYGRMGMGSTRSFATWGWTTTTPSDRMVLHQAVEAGNGVLRDEDGEEILELMRTVQASQKWGVGTMAGAGETAYVKNGWLPRLTQGGRWIVSSSGLVRGPATTLHLAVCSRGHSSESAGITFVEAVLHACRTSLQV